MASLRELHDLLLYLFEDRDLYRVYVSYARGKKLRCVGYIEIGPHSGLLHGNLVVPTQKGGTRKQILLGCDEQFKKKKDETVEQKEVVSPTEVLS